MQLVACDSPAGRLGLTICYDIRFPEVYQALTFQHQAEILLVPSAFTKLTGKDGLTYNQGSFTPIKLHIQALELQWLCRCQGSIYWLAYGGKANAGFFAYKALDCSCL